MGCVGAQHECPSWDVPGATSVNVGGCVARLDRGDDERFCAAGDEHARGPARQARTLQTCNVRQPLHISQLQELPRMVQPSIVRRSATN